MKRLAGWVMAAGVMAMVAGVAWGELTSEQTKEAAALIKDFAAKEFAVRQTAVEKLIAMGPDVLDPVRKAMAETTDDEVKLRCQMVVKGIDKEAKAEEEVERTVREVEVTTATVNGETSVTATLHNEGAQIALVEARVKMPKELKLTAPGAAVICFVDPGSNVDVKWQAKATVEGEWRCEAEVDVISRAQKRNGTLPEIPAAQKEALEEVWTGRWESPSGHAYDADMHLRVNANRTVEGRLEWTLEKTPVGSPDAEKIGMGGVEYVWGAYDERTRGLYMMGYRLDDPEGILGMDRYMLRLSKGGDGIEGATWNHGPWTGKFALKPKEGK